jgi:hypothetical protein
VSKRHHTSRRKTYGRRQHELRERPDRRTTPEIADAAWDDEGTGSPAGTFVRFALDPGASRIRFALD